MVDGTNAALVRRTEAKTPECVTMPDVTTPLWSLTLAAPLERGLDQPPRLHAALKVLLVLLASRL